MEKSRWPDFISSKLRSQIALENGQKAQIWVLVLLELVTLGFAFQAVGSSADRSFLYATKILFLTLSHLFLILGFYLPNLLQKGEKPLSGLLGIRDFTSLIVVSLALAFYSMVTLMLSYQAAVGTPGVDTSAFLNFAAWINLIVAAVYFSGSLFFLASLLLFPAPFAKILERGAKAFYVLLGLHVALGFLLGWGYSQIVPIGSSIFFEQFRVAGLFWIFIVTSLLFIGKLFSGSSISALAAIELDIASGRLERQEDILARLKEAFVLRRLGFWIHHFSHRVATTAHEIAQYCHNAVTLVSNEKPTELDLRQVEDRYKRADHLYRKLDKENQKFLLSISFFNLTEAEQEKIEELKDQFSRELRNAKLELASIRKRVDERLVAIKNSAPKFSPAPEVTVEKLPVSR